MKRFLSVPGIALIALVALAPAADAQLYLATADDTNTCNLYAVNPATAVSTLVGPVTVGATPLGGVTGLAFQPGTNVLYGITSNSTPMSRSLLTINPSNGNATFIGTFGTPIGDISFGSNGTLYGWQKNTGGALRGSLSRNALAPPPTDNLVTLSLSTGAATPIGSPGITNSQGSSLAFVLGTLYLSVANSNGALRTVNPTTGLTTVGPTMNGTGQHLSAMSASPGGVLYAVAGTSSLVTINTTTGALTTVGVGGNLPSGSDALAFLGSAIGPAGAGLLDIPALGPFALLLLGVLLAAAGLLLIRIR